MIAKYNLNYVLKRIIQDFEDAVIDLTLSQSGILDSIERAEVDRNYMVSKIELIDLIGEMDEKIYGKGGGLSNKKRSPAAKRNRASKKQKRETRSAKPGRKK